jgi:hypothetical protein
LLLRVNLDDNLSNPYQSTPAINAMSSTNPLPTEATCGGCGATRARDGAPLSHCSRCKKQKYCSKECQTNHWPAHKLVCKSANKNSSGDNKKKNANTDADTKNGEWLELMDMIAKRNNNNDVKVLTCRLDFSNLSLPITTYYGPNGRYEPGGFAATRDEIKNQGSYLRVDSALLNAIGFPSPVVGWMVSLAEPRNLLPDNPARCLLMDPDPASATFRQIALAKGELPKHRVDVGRKDDKVLLPQHVEALVTYVREDLREIKEVAIKEARDETVDRNELARRLLTPEAFVTAFARIKAAKIAAGRKEWEGVECPVNV